MLFSKFLTLATLMAAASAALITPRITGNCDSGACLCSTNLVDSDGSVIGIAANCVAADATTGQCGAGCVLTSGPTPCTNSLNQAGGTTCSQFVRCADQHKADAGGCTACLHGSTNTCPGISCVAC